MSQRCSACSQPVIWATTSKGNKMPLDAQPHPMGNLVLDDGGNVGPPDSQFPGTPDLTRRYKSHFSTCVHADRFRKK